MCDVNVAVLNKYCDVVPGPGAVLWEKTGKKGLNIIIGNKERDVAQR